MQRIVMTMVLCVGWSVCTCWAGVKELATEIVRAGNNIPGGICSIMDAKDANLALAIRQQGSFTVHCLCSDAQTCAKVRQQIHASDTSGRISADVATGAHLPYIDHLINVVVAPLGLLSKEDKEEVIRVLCPNGVAIDPSHPSQDVLRKPWPADIDEWTHYLHGADGNPVAQDRVVGPPKHYQWIEGPMWQRDHETDSNVSSVVTAGGRLFAIVDEGPIGLVGPHVDLDKWSLIARDAFNGTLLWKVPIKHWGWREWKDTWFATRPNDIPLNVQKRLVAVGDKVYITLGYQAPVSELDARTGKILQTYAGTERTNEILVFQGRLFLSVLTSDKARVMAVDAASGKPLWTSPQTYAGTTVDYLKWTITPVSRTIPKLDPALNLATDGQVVTLIDGAQLVCLDANTGKKRWHVRPPMAAEDRSTGLAKLNAKAKKAKAKTKAKIEIDDPAKAKDDSLWMGSMIVSDGVVLQANPSLLAAFSADTGKLLWSQPKKHIGHLWYEWKEVFVVDHLVWTWSAELETFNYRSGAKGKQSANYPLSVNGYDLHTGELKKKVPTGPIFITHHHHRCYRDKATIRYILASRRGTEFVDLEKGEHSVHNWVRSTCHVGMMPANGLQYVPPHPCACYFEEKLNGFFALGPQRADDSLPSSQMSERLDKGPAYSFDPKLSISVADWPAFRADALRSGSVHTEVPDDAAPLWRVKLGSAVTPPIMVGDRVFTALTDEHYVVCLDASDGRKVWEFACGARIDSSPTWYNGMLLFGSADGRLYCVRASDGQLVWQFTAAPKKHLISVFGQLESTHPIHGCVLVQDGKAYFAAGRTSELDHGMWLYALDAATGQVLHRTHLEGPDYVVNDQGKLAMQPPPSSGQATFDNNHELPMGSLSDVLASDGKRIYMRTDAFDAQLQPQQGKPEQTPKNGYLDDSYFKRMPWSFGSQADYGSLLVHDDKTVYFVRTFDSLKGLDPMVFFSPGDKGYLLFGKSLSGKRSAQKDTWSQRVPVRVRAMVLAMANQRLVVAGPPDVVDPKDPWSAFEGRSGGVMYVMDAVNGRKMAELKLPSPPVFNGAAAANGRLCIADEEGFVSCFGKR